MHRTAPFYQTALPVTGSVSTTPATETPNFVSVGASASGTIPANSKSWSFLILTGTGSIGTVPLSAGQGLSGTNQILSSIAYTTDAASSAIVYYGS